MSKVAHAAARVQDSARESGEVYEERDEVQTRTGQGQTRGLDAALRDRVTVSSSKYPMCGCQVASSHCAAGGEKMSPVGGSRHYSTLSKKSKGEGRWGEEKGEANI